jgi:trehalose 6-phosphate synthase/phosphatase
MSSVSGIFLERMKMCTHFFEPELPQHATPFPRTKGPDGLKSPGERRPSSFKFPANKNSSKSSHSKSQRPAQNQEKRNHGPVSWQPPVPDKNLWNVLDLKAENYFSCAVGRSRTEARYLLPSPDDVVSFLNKLAHPTVSNAPSSSS